MHSLTIVFGPAATAWTLLFKNSESLEMARTMLVGTEIDTAFVVTDDFGQNVAISRSGLHGFMIEDMDLSQQAQVERGVHQARTQAKAQEKAMIDPIISASIRRQQMGPAVFQPGMPNGRGMM